MKMTQEEVLAELNALVLKAEDPEDFLTSEELMDAWGLGICAVRRRIKLAKKAGRLERRKVRKINVADEYYMVPAYRLMSDG